MRRRILACFAAGLLGFTVAPAQASDTGIEVRVINAETRRALEGVEVAITARDGETATATTNTDGVAQVTSLEPGLYALGRPGPESHVFVTANYTLSLHALAAPGAVPHFQPVIHGNGQGIARRRRGDKTNTQKSHSSEAN